MKRLFLSACMSLATAVALVPSLGHSAVGAERDGAFFRSVAGSWSGPGEIVAGKYKGTRFVCTFTGEPKSGALGLSLDGDCRVGVFTQKMTASLQHDGSSYRGKFMDGAAGKGLDITAGNVVGDKVVLSVNRAQLNGVMQARVPDANTMKVTVSVRVENKLVPVIGVSLKRVDGMTVSSTDPN